MAEDLALVVNGFRYEGWKSIRVTRSMESIAGSFALEVNDRWAGDETWTILEEDACRVEIGSDVVINGHIAARNPSGSASARSLSYTGRDRAAALVENSLVLKQWTFRNLTLFEFATAIAKMWSVSVSLQPGLVLKKRDKIVVQPGDKAFESLSREAAEDGVMLVSDGAGGIVITRSGTARATPLVEGANILTGSADYDGTDRYHRYVIATQAAATDDAFGDATRILAEAFDEGVRRTDRVLFIRPDKGYSVADARARADWEARTRAARAETVTIVVQGWKQPDGKLWPINAITRVRASRLIGVDGDMLITQVENTVGDGGKITQLRLMRPDAFTPEPKATVKSSEKSGNAGWKELEKGAL